MGDEPIRQIGKDLLTYAEASRHLAEAHLGENDWSGLPVPVVGLHLVLEPRYKHKCLEEFRWKECYDENGNRHEIPEEQQPEPSDLKKVNSWWSSKYQVTFVVFHDRQGRPTIRVAPEDRLAFTIRTLEAAAVWPVEAEQKAQKKLASLIT